jgi:RecJ-like exonuclease
MNREKFARICLLLSVVGLALMYGATEFMQLEKVDPGEVSKEDIGKSFRVEGNVSDFYRTDSASFFTLNGENGSIKMVDFQRRSFPDGATLTVRGQVELYRGELEIVSTEIEQ